MSSIVYHTDFSQRSIQWDAIRLGKLTASALDKIITPAKLALSSQSRGLALTLAAERITRRKEDGPESYDMERGVLLEPEARHVYSTHFGPVEEVAFLQNESVPFPFGASPDGLIDNRLGAIEIKCPRAPRHLETILTGKIDGGYMLQMQGIILAGGLQYVDFCSFHEGLKLKPIRVPRDEKVIDAIIAAGKLFEEQVREILDAYLQAGGVETNFPEEIEV